MAELAVEWEQQQDVKGTIDAVTADALETIPGADAAFLVQPARRSLRFSGATGAEARSAAHLEQASGGPSTTALANNVVVQVNQIADDERWPEYSAVATDVGLGSMLAVPMEVNSKVIGTLAVFCEEADGFSDQAVAGTQLYANHAAVALEQAQDHADLSAAVQGRDVIGRAKGILMERHRLTDEQAFALLVTASQHSNVPVREVAQSLSESGRMPE